MIEGLLPAALVQTDAMCFLVLLIMLFKTVKNRRGTKGFRCLVYMMISALIFCVSNVLCNLVAWEVLRVSDFTNYFVNFVYFSSFGFQAFSWFIYSESLQNSIFVKNLRNKHISAIPLGFEILLAALTPFCHLYYYIEDGAYMRGPLLLPVTAGCIYLYFFSTSLKAFIRSGKKKNYADREMLRNLAYFAAFPLIATFMQYFFSGISFPTIGFTLGLLMVYIRTDELQISIDPLTGINNRSHLVQQISFKMKNHSEDKLLFLLMIDVNHFKKINDTYGHLEGDRALVRTASALRNTAAKGNFIARFGGDEFIVIGEVERLKEITELCDKINTELFRLDGENHLPYEITLSIGYAILDRSMETIPDFIARADEALYIAKKSVKKG